MNTRAYQAGQGISNPSHNEISMVANGAFEANEDESGMPRSRMSIGQPVLCNGPLIRVAKGNLLPGWMLGTYSASGAVFTALQGFRAGTRIEY